MSTETKDMPVTIADMVRKARISALRDAALIAEKAKVPEWDTVQMTAHLRWRTGDEIASAIRYQADLLERLYVTPTLDFDDKIEGE